ncbi:MAG: threonine--tRNA ligase, partial [bacterium]|nr:threonine--tRNA ligase [bacterium]
MANNGITIESVRHSLAHLLAMAVLKKFPTAKLGIGPTIEHGFYYDFKLPRPISEADLGPLEATMRELIAARLDFKGQKVTPAKARTLFKGQPFKLDLAKEFVKEKKQLTVYTTADLRRRNADQRGKLLHKSASDRRESAFVDLCRGGHVKNTAEINPEAFKLTKIAGAYWRGDEKNSQLTRIYGLAFPTKKELDEHLRLIVEAERRDHKRLGAALDLFTFSDLVGPGLPLWTPKGTILRDVLDNFVWELRKKHGYERVDIPHLAKKELYEKSGHWEKFKDELFRITTREGHLFAVKPMNCPHHVELYARRKWSYRELPQRYASTTKVYRDEQTGELSGLARVRAITQDDAHVFCRRSQIKDEALKIWDIITAFYGAVGFRLTPALSLHDPKQRKKYLGTPKVWQEAETILREIVRERDARTREAIGEAAFYGPKVDFLASDSLGREWQVATIQLDLNMPGRFGLSCIGEDGKPEQIAMIHAAIMGSIERYIAILIEHYAGAFPLWLAPVQVALLPITDKVKSYCLDALRELRRQDLRVTL